MSRHPKAKRREKERKKREEGEREKRMSHVVNSYVRLMNIERALCSFEVIVFIVSIQFQTITVSSLGFVLLNSS